MPEYSLIVLKDLLHDFNDMSLTDFRQALSTTMSDIDPFGIQLLLNQLKDFRGNRSLRAAIAASLAELEDEQYLDDFSEVIEVETDVGLCRECIQGIVRMGTKDSHARLVQLAKDKPNATIATLLRQELEKLNQKEPLDYYFNNLKKGEASARGTTAASRVLISIGEDKIVDRILPVFTEFDGLGRVEAARVVSQLGQVRHLEPLLPLLDSFVNRYKKRLQFVSEIETLQGLGKSDKMGHLYRFGQNWVSKGKTEVYNNILEHLQEGHLNRAKALGEELIAESQIGFPFYFKSMIMLHNNQVALATKYQTDTLKDNRIKISRYRQLLGFFAEGLGRIVEQGDVSEDIRSQVVSRMKHFLEIQSPDMQKMALFGVACFVKPNDSELLELVASSNQVEGLMVLLKKISKKNDPGFIPFFIGLVENHQLVDVQELALQALADLPEVESAIEEMMNSAHTEELRTGIRIVGSIKSKLFIPRLLKLVEDQSDFLRADVIEALGRIGDPATLGSIETVLYDARNPNLIEACLNAMGEMKNEQATEALKRFSEKTQNREKALSALEHLIRYYHRWDFPLPQEDSESTIELLNEFILGPNKDNRLKSYTAASRVITWDLGLYQKLRELLKEATSKLRAQSNWDKKEKPALEKAQKSLNRSYYFLKDALEYQEKIEGMFRRSRGANDSRWLSEFERVCKTIEQSQFPMSPEFLKKLAERVIEELQQRENWREKALLYRLAGYSRVESLIDVLLVHLKSVPRQARNALMEALNMLGFTMQDITDAVKIKSVCLLEGSRFFNKKLTHHLRNMMLTVSSFDTVEAVEKFLSGTSAEKCPDCLITELTLQNPGDLIPYVEKWRANLPPSLEIIVQTNLREPKRLEKMKQLGIRGLVLKPYPLERLEEVIRGT
ncbi:MAG: hypothetical protein CR997_07805 [Acidobacteria bacterium]|nr:MAG: hypothetical protein CR997_07805 [Acidobacteriota bacterium]